MSIEGDRDKERRRDESIHKGYYKTEGKPVPDYNRTKKDGPPAVDETNADEILESLRRLTGFVPPSTNTEDQQ